MGEFSLPRSILMDVRLAKFALVVAKSQLRIGDLPRIMGAGMPDPT